MVLAVDESAFAPHNDNVLATLDRGDPCLSHHDAFYSGAGGPRLAVDVVKIV